MGHAKPNMLLDDTYKDETLNPTEVLPEQKLRIVFERVAEKAYKVPVAILQSLMEGGFDRAHSWGAGLGETRAQAERHLGGLDEITSHWASTGARPSLRRAELAFLLSVWEELRGEAAATNEILIKNKHISQPVIIEVPHDERRAARHPALHAGGKILQG